MKRIFAVLAIAVAAGTAFSADVDKKKLVGKWEITKSGGDAPAGTLVEFTADDKLTVEVKANDQVIKIAGTYKLEKDKIAYTLKIMDQEQKEELTVKEITDSKLVLEDKDKKIDELKKVK